MSNAVRGVQAVWPVYRRQIYVSGVSGYEMTLRAIQLRPVRKLRSRLIRAEIGINFK
jgi:hypothetical protein